MDCISFSNVGEAIPPHAGTQAGKGAGGWPREYSVPYAELKKQYASAREIGYILMAEDVIDIADNSAVAAGAPDPRLRVETRKWLLSKVLPKIYGDKQTVDGKFTVDWAVVAQEAADKYKQKHEHES